MFANVNNPIFKRFANISFVSCIKSIAIIQVCSLLLNLSKNRHKVRVLGSIFIKFGPLVETMKYYPNF